MDFVNQELQMYLAQAIGFIPRLIAALIIFIATLLLARLAVRVTGETAERRKIDPEIKRLLQRLVHIAILVMGIIVALDQVDFEVTAFIAGLGVVGFALGFAFQDIAKNFISGILLLLEQPFEIGDAIEVGDHRGVVADIELRATTLQGYDGKQIIIPNADVYTKPIVNITRHPLRRIELSLGLGYDEDIERARKVFTQAIQSLEGVKSDPTPVVICNALADSWVEMQALFWINHRTANFAEVRTQAIRVLLEAAARERIDLPYPTQIVRLHQMLEDQTL